MKLVVIKKSDISIYIGSKEMKCEKRKKMGLDILEIFVLTVHPCTVFVLLLRVKLTHIHVSLLVCFQFPI